MKIAEALAAKQTFSFEIFPPKGDFSVEEATKVAGELAFCNPDFISITFSAGGSGNSGNTAAIAARIQQENPYVMTMAHLTCMGSTRSEVDAYVSRLQADGEKMSWRCVAIQFLAVNRKTSPMHVTSFPI